MKANIREEICEGLATFFQLQKTLYKREQIAFDKNVLQDFLSSLGGTSENAPAEKSLSKRKEDSLQVNKSDLQGINSAKVPKKDSVKTHLPIPLEIILPPGSKQEQWAWLREKVMTCPHCLANVHPGKKLVFGSGNLDADIFFCGEAPGADEETQGEVFVGRAGQLLTKIIEAMGLRRSDVYIGNIMNWRPDTPNQIGNRPPTQEEMAFCLPYLKGQVDIVKPKVIVALGSTAVNGLLGCDPNRRMRDCRGQWFSFNQIPLTITYHPSYILRNATNATKRLIWEDMLRVMEFLHMPISEKQQRYFL